MRTQISFFTPEDCVHVFQEQNVDMKFSFAGDEVCLQALDNRLRVIPMSHSL